ncbi:MAG TPA: phosphate acyltransferase PlsX [Clostridia bacterium]|jgi:glycerol-3-phosphate acyltransferase PlsX|nr:phosphate acyltransferase PlsX [Clostridiaceae bacterium]HOF26918.1 phosphate acyltransferase PlsX [Clostridia bacterium]HOM34572.1 phosphate acyltransferase PlsX [Clostridia bacterium]HOR89940.1 phosphate acyltransferase PlsX [Clostridia bacterium]HOT70209.1 phosphate acyltransferase PlsX [Clostridia bacterium]
MNILVDAMGGDNAPEAIVIGCLNAIKTEEGFDITLFGDSKIIADILCNYNYDKSRIKVEHCSEVILFKDTPTVAVKNKKDSSLVRALTAMREGNGDAVISAGNTGALLTGSLLITGRMQKVIRPALGALIPSGEKFALLIDAGLNSNLRPESYVQFAKFGSEYMKIVTKCDNPLIGLLNIGTEDTKGSAEVKEANLLLKQSGLNYYGSIEGNSIVEGVVDVVVTDGFTGNVSLKVLEGTASYIFSKMKSVFSMDVFHKLAASVIRPDMKKFKDNLNPDIMGGAPILGVNGLILKSHGSSNAKTIMHVVLKAVKLAKNDIVGNIRRAVC